METNVDVVFFDLFYTLVTPKYNKNENENDVLGITIKDWEVYTEDSELYEERAIGNEKVPIKIIENIIGKMKIHVNELDKTKILRLRKERFKKSLINVDGNITDVLLHLKKNGKKICLISNADIIDVMHWEKSPLCNLFDDTIFSYEVGYLKPQSEIYKIALQRMNTKPERSIFIGDGGSDELKGAKKLGIKTILTSYLLKRNDKQINMIKQFADYYIEDFQEIRNILL